MIILKGIEYCIEGGINDNYETVEYETIIATFSNSKLAYQYVENSKTKQKARGFFPRPFKDNSLLAKYNSSRIDIIHPEDYPLDPEIKL